MPIVIVEADPHSPEVAAVLRESHRLMTALFPPEHNSFLDLDALSDDAITLWAAHRGDAVLGTIALRQEGASGEVKSFFVTEAARGLGVGAGLLVHLEAAARARGIDRLLLETGTGLDAAARLYVRAGYVRRGPFGEYAENGTSVFFDKPLSHCGRTG